ncbi:MAG TPA: electron transfer flavoprotein subunit alpha/FixB family protein, partial [Magnetospirillaceae bacterium]|nr:electron transfer flavoprotein subunit alpha/FixB family protein [Magnetospirillaceae bacterium]
MSVLVVAEHDGAHLKAATLSTIAAAAQLGEVTVLVTGHNCQAAADAAAKTASVSKVLLAEDAAYEHGLAEPLSLLVAGLAKTFAAVLAP